MTPRLQKLRQRISELALDAILVSHPVNRQYLSGFSGSAGYLFITAEKATLATDFRYIEQARSQAPDFKIIKITSGFAGWLPRLILETGGASIGFEADEVTFSTHRQMVSAIQKLPPKSRPRLIATKGLTERLRCIKDKAEIALIQKAAKLADLAVAHAAQTLRSDMTEKQLAWELEQFMRENGSQTMPFDIIVASGPNSALPHAQPTERRILPSEPVVIDLGAKIEGYTSDITRTLCLGEPSEKLRQIYRIVHQAQMVAISKIEPGISGDKADNLARDVIEKAGCAEAFGHGLGHGVGMETHEMPRLGNSSQDILQPNMIFTVEPGIYLPGWGGVRIEDMVLLEAAGTCVMTQAKKYDF